MASNPPHPFSPHRSPIRRRTTTSQVNEGGRWTVDNSESRFVSLLQSPSRSILRAPNTPLRFHYSSQEKRNEQLRKVSFAREAHLRVFDQNESPDITSRSIPNLFEESRPNFDDNAFNSPSSNLFMTNSPSNRKRRPDLFGSPTSVQQSPKRRTGGAPPSLLARLENEGEDSADLTRYLSMQPGNVRRNIFEEDDDDDDDEEDISLEEFRPSAGSEPVSEIGFQSRPRQLFQPSTPSERTFEPTLERTPDPVSEQVPERRSESMFEPTPDRLSELQFAPTPDRASESVFDPPLEPTPERRVSEPRFDPPFEKTPERSSAPSTTLVQEEVVDASLQYTDNGDDMIITQEVPLPQPTEEESIPYLEEETMIITQELPTSFASPLYTPIRSTTNPSPMRTPERQTPSRFLQPTTLNQSHFRSPERPTQQSTTPFNPSPIRSSVLTPVRESRVLYSEQRSFHLHDHTPTRENENETVDFDNVFTEGNNDIMEEEWSQLYNTMQDGIIPTPNMSLSEFLGNVGITFTSHTPRESKRLSQHNRNYDAATEADQAYAAAVTLPELALYKKEITQLHDLIHKSQETIDHIDHDISANNPQFFAEFLDSDIAIRTKIEIRMKEIKAYALSKALQQWYAIWLKSLEPLLVELKRNNGKIQIDKEKISSFQQLIKPKLTEIVSYKIKLDPVLHLLRKEEKEYDKVDHEKLDSYVHEIDNLRLAVQDLTVEAQEIEKEEKELQERESQIEKELSSAQKEIHQAETTIADNKFVTRNELLLKKDDFERLIELGSWKMETPEDNILHMKLDHNVHVKIDKKKLMLKQPDAVFINMLDSRDRTLGPVAELVHGLSVIAQDKWNLDEIMQDIAIYWNRFMMIQQDLIDVQRRFWIEIEALEFEEPENAGISCKICVYSFIGRTKFTVSFMVKPNDVMNYPFIDTSSLGLTIHFGAIEYNQLKSIIEKELSTHGMNDIVDTLTGVLERIAIPE